MPLLATGPATHPMQVETSAQSYLRDDLLKPVVIRDIIIDGAGDIALDVAFPPTHSYLWPTVTIENVVIRGDWRIGIRLENCWNAKLTNVYVTGLVTEETIRRPKMEVGIDCGNSMDVHVINPNVNGAQIAVRVRDLDLAGHGEGFHVEGGWLMNVGTGVKLEGFGSGGWPTPLAHVHRCHIAHLDVGIDVRKYFAVHLSDNNLYGTEFSHYPLAVYAEDCRTLHVRDNEFWQNKHGRSGCAMAFTRCTQIRLRDNVVEPNWLADCVIDPGCTKVVDGGNEWELPRVFDLR